MGINLTDEARYLASNFKGLSIDEILALRATPEYQEHRANVLEALRAA